MEGIELLVLDELLWDVLQRAMPLWGFGCLRLVCQRWTWVLEQRVSRVRLWERKGLLDTHMLSAYLQRLPSLASILYMHTLSNYDDQFLPTTFAQTMENIQELEIDIS